MIKDIDVFILCGGLGKRLRPVSQNMPKPMIEVGHRPFLDIIIDYMAGFGAKRFILGTGYRSGVIKDYYLRNKKPGLSIVFSHEKAPLDTGGALKNAKRLIKSRHFFVLNGDSFCRFNPEAFFDFHKRKKALVSMLLKRVSRAKEYGQVKLDRNRSIKSFNEKNLGAGKSLVNAGIYIFDKEAFSVMPRENKFSLERDIFPGLADNRLFGYAKSGFFIDIGTPQRYFKAKAYFSKKSSLWKK